MVRAPRRPRPECPPSMRGFKPQALGRGNRVFITHRMNKKILEQVKELVAFGKFAPVVARDRETARPFPHDVMDEMRGCDTAVIHVGVDGLLFDGGDNEEPRISGDVLIEIGAAMALYGRNFILLVEEGVNAAGEPAGPLRVPLQRRRIGHVGHDDAVQGLQRLYEVPARATIGARHRRGSCRAARASIRAHRHFGSGQELIWEKPAASDIGGLRKAPTRPAMTVPGFAWRCARARRDSSRRCAPSPRRGGSPRSSG